MNQLRVLAPALLLALTAALSGCGSSDSDASAPPGEGVSVDHRFGTTSVDSPPQRIVTLDVQWTDVVLSMGVEPVGYSVDSLMPEDEPPWRTGTRSGEPLSLDDGVPVEEIAALDPDLIVGTYSIADQQTYDQLSTIAPTIAGSAQVDSVQSWQNLVTTAGSILHEPEEADRVVSSVERETERLAEDLPGLRGKTFALAQYVVGDGLTVVADENDGSSKLFQQLGMTLLPAVESEGEETGSARVTVSTERVDLLASDFLAFLVNGGDESDLADLPGFDELPASRAGTAAVLDYATVVGINTPTPLSIPYVLDRLRPYLERAA
ncbi:MAG: ABC transporter substrate-binding protein [Nocardioidaceae bacterium]